MSGTSNFAGACVNTEQSPHTSTVLITNALILPTNFIDFNGTIYISRTKILAIKHKQLPFLI